MSPAAAARRDAFPAGERAAAAPRRRGSGRGRTLLWWALVVGTSVGSLAYVVRRQEQAVERERALRAVEADLGVAEGERVELLNRIQRLRSRARVVREARARLGMHLPGDAEIVLLPLPADPAPGGDPEAAGAEEAP